MYNCGSMVNSARALPAPGSTAVATGRTWGGGGLGTWGGGPTRHATRGKTWGSGQRCVATTTLATAVSDQRGRQEGMDDASVERPQVYREVWKPPKPSRMVKDNRGFEEEHRIRGYEVGPDRKTTMITIANLMQEIASNHAVAMWGRTDEGFATDPEMAKQGLIFVMTRMQIQMDTYPKWGDVVTFETWFQQSGRMRAQRDWSVRDDGGREIGRGTSTWVMINMKTRRPCKMPDEIKARCSWFERDPPEHAIGGIRQI